MLSTARCVALAKLGVHGVDAVGRQHPSTGVDVGRGETDIAAFAVSLNDSPLNGEVSAEHLAGVVESPLAHGVADAGAAHCLAVERHGLQTVHVKAKRLAKGQQRLDVAISPVAKRKVGPHANAVDGPEAVEEFADKCLARFLAESGVEPDDQRSVDSGGLNGAESLWSGLQQGRGAVGRDHVCRVLVERDSDSQSLMPGGVIHRLPEYLLVTQVHAVEHAYREADSAIAVGQIAGLVELLHVAGAESLSIGTTRLAKSAGERFVNSSRVVAPLILNLPETVRRSPARCAPQPSVWPRSCASERT